MPEPQWRATPYRLLALNTVLKWLKKLEWALEIYFIQHLSQTGNQRKAYCALH